MSYSAQPRSKDHWSMRLKVKRPGGVRTVALVVAAIQTVCLALTVSSFATGGSLYGCTSACGTAAQPVTPPFAVILGIVMLAAPLFIGAFCADWQLGVTLAVLPMLPALLIASNPLLAPTNTIVPPTRATATQPAVPYATSHFGPPFWLDPTHLQTLLFAFTLFALLGWLGWVIGSAFFRES
ncbi:MAG TPA: hypothetical protein VF808_18255 [Ktedonobacterales bacterium]